MEASIWRAPPRKNAHVIERGFVPESFDGSVIVVGKESPRSQLLKHARQISCIGKDRKGRPLRVVGENVRYDGRLRNWKSILGLEGSLQRSYTRWIRPDRIARLEKELEHD